MVYGMVYFSPHNEVLISISIESCATLPFRFMKATSWLCIVGSCLKNLFPREGGRHDGVRCLPLLVARFAVY